MIYLFVCLHVCIITTYLSLLYVQLVWHTIKYEYLTCIFSFVACIVCCLCNQYEKVCWSSVMLL